MIKIRSGQGPDLTNSCFAVLLFASDTRLLFESLGTRLMDASHYALEPDGGVNRSSWAHKACLQTPPDSLSPFTMVGLYTLIPADVRRWVADLRG